MVKCKFSEATIKKVMIQVVKLLFFILFPLSLFSQDVINGSFVLSTPSGEGGSVFHFKNSNRFNFKMHMGADQTFISSGYYLISKDTLILMHEILIDGDSSYYEIISESNHIEPQFGKKQMVSAEALNIEFTVLATDKTVLPGATVVALQDDQIIFIETLNEKGKVDIYSSGKFIDEFKINYIGYKNLSISAESFWGKKSSLNVFLSPAETYVNDKNRIVKFYLNRNDSNEIVSYGKRDSDFKYIKEK